MDDRVLAGLIGMELEDAGQLPIGKELTRGMAIRMILGVLASMKSRSAGAEPVSAASEAIRRA